MSPERAHTLSSCGGFSSPGCQARASRRRSRNSRGEASRSSRPTMRRGVSGRSRRTATSGTRSSSADCSIVSTRRPCSCRGRLEPGTVLPALRRGCAPSAPADVLLRRVTSRTTNDYGKSIDERQRIVGDISHVERLLRAACTHEIDATQSVAAVVAELAAIGEDAPADDQRRRSSRLRQIGMSPADGLVGARRSPWNCDA